MEKPNYKKKYGKSVSKLQCVTPCYFANVNAIHPLYYESITEKFPFCGTAEWTRKNGVKEISDKCTNPTETAYKYDGYRDILPYVSFDAKIFLKIYYKINDINMGFEWLETNKNNVNINTRIRIAKLVLLSYGNEVDFVHPYFPQFFIEYIKKTYIRTIYDKIHIYVNYDNKTKEINIATNELDKHVMCDNRINYIIKMFLNITNVSKFLNNYFAYFFIPSG